MKRYGRIGKDRSSDDDIKNTDRIIATVCRQYGYSLSYVLHELRYSELIALYLYGLEYDRDQAVNIAIEQAITQYGIPEDKKEETAVQRLKRRQFLQQYIERPINANLRPELIKK